MKHPEFNDFSYFSGDMDFDPAFEEDYFQDFDLDKELNLFLDETDFDGMDDFYGLDN